MKAELFEYDALGLAEMVREGETKSSELVEITIDRIERINPKVNAVIHKMYEEARDQAQKWNKEIKRSVYLLTYWAWWRGAGRGWIGRFRGKKPEDFSDKVEKAITEGLNRLGENEEELRDILLQYFIEKSEGLKNDS